MLSHLTQTPCAAVCPAAKHGCERTFTSLEELGRSDAVDAVYLASPTSEHARQATLLLGMGKHVLCEKPATSNSTELEAVLAAASSSGCAFMEAMRPLKTPNYAATLATLAELGPVRHFSGNFCQLSSRWPAWLQCEAAGHGGDGPTPNAFLPGLSNGALMDLCAADRPSASYQLPPSTALRTPLLHSVAWADIRTPWPRFARRRGCYATYAAVQLLGKPSSVSYVPLMLPTGVDGGGTLLLRYEHGIATLVISKCSHSFNQSELQTENGTVSIDNLGEWSEVALRKKGGEPKPFTVVGGADSAPPNNLWCAPPRLPNALHSEAIRSAPCLDEDHRSHAGAGAGAGAAGAGMSWTRSSSSCSKGNNRMM
jgi:predicted dehydrogenase